MKNKITLLLLSTVLISSCSLAPDYFRPKVETPSQWSNGQGAQATPKLAFDWWKSFSSDELNQLMAQALNNNLDLQAAFHRIQQARGSLQIARAPLFPSLEATGTVTRDQTIRSNGDIVNSGGSGRSSSGDYNGSAGLNVNYEVDLFGANKSNYDASKATYLSTRYEGDAVALVVMADVSETYFDVLNARERLKIADSNLKNAQEILRIVQARYNAGSASGLEIAQQKGSLASFEAARSSIAQEIKVNENALAILLARPPQSVTIEKTDMTNLKIPAISPGQPSELLERRPDIKEAEEQLIAANADIGVARAAFFPKIDLTVGLTAAASPITSSLTSGVSTASSIVQSIFEGGSLMGNLTLTKARKAELVDNYRKVVLVAFQEVENALTAEKTSAEREKSYKTAMEQAQKAFNISTLQYKAGSIDFQTVIDSQGTLLQAQENYSVSRNDRLTAAVDLFKALGGGWDSAAR